MTDDQRAGSRAPASDRRAVKSEDRSARPESVGEPRPRESGADADAIVRRAVRLGYDPWRVATALQVDVTAALGRGGRYAEVADGTGDQI